MKVTYDLNDDAPRYVIEALIAVDRPLSSYDLADNYDPPKPNNMTELKNEFREETGDEGRINDCDVKEWLIREAIDEINTYNDIEGGAIIEVGGDYRFADGVDPEQLQISGGELLIRRPVLPNLFTPETGLWVNNVRSADLTANDAKDKELRESMKVHGWLPSLPGIQDEHGVLITGHRRLAVAEELGIDLNIQTRHFGDGPAADAARVALALASNVGAKPFSPADRKKIAKDLHGSTKFSMTEIGELLKVSVMTVSRDLRDLTDVKSDESKPKRGRPRKKPEPKPEPINEPKPTPPLEPKPEPPGGLTENTPGQTDRVEQALERAKKNSEPEPIVDTDGKTFAIRFTESSVWSYIDAVEDIGLYTGDDFDLVTPLTADDLPEPPTRRSDGGAEFFREQADRLRATLPRILVLIVLLDQRASEGDEDAA